MAVRRDRSDSVRWWRFVADISLLYAPLVVALWLALIYLFYAPLGCRRERAIFIRPSEGGGWAATPEETPIEFYGEAALPGYAGSDITPEFRAAPLPKWSGKPEDIMPLSQTVDLPLTLGALLAAKKLAFVEKAECRSDCGEYGRTCPNCDTFENNDVAIGVDGRLELHEL